MKKLTINNMDLTIGKPKIVIPIMAETHEQILEECEDAIEQPCDILEWRADYYLNRVRNLSEEIDSSDVHLEIIKILDDINYMADEKPLIFTIRSVAQGGRARISREQEYEISALAAQSGLVHFIDMELFDDDDRFDEQQIRSQVDEIHSLGCRVIMSYHDYKAMPTCEQMRNVVTIMRALGADIAKIAAYVSTKQKSVEMLKCARMFTEGDEGPVILIGMGEKGLITRVAGGRYGSCITFAAGRGTTAAGQVNAITLNGLLSEYYK